MKVFATYTLAHQGTTGSLDPLDPLSFCDCAESAEVHWNLVECNPKLPVLADCSASHPSRLQSLLLGKWQALKVIEQSPHPSPVLFVFWISTYLPSDDCPAILEGNGGRSPQGIIWRGFTNNLRLKTLQSPSRNSSKETSWRLLIV